MENNKKQNIFELSKKLLNTIQYNGVYIFLAIVFPLILFGFDAGREIIRSLAEETSGLNLSLCLVSFFILGYAVWCIPTLAIPFFQFMTGCTTENKTASEDLFKSLIKVYNNDNAIETSTVSPAYFENNGKSQFPIRWFALFPWVMFLFTYDYVIYEEEGKWFCLNIGIVIAFFLLANFLFKKYGNQLKLPRKGWVFFVKFTLPFLLLLMLPFLLGKIPANTHIFNIIGPMGAALFYQIIRLLESNKKKNNISDFNYKSLLIVLVLATVTLYGLNEKQKLPYVSPVVVLIIFSATIITVVDFFVTSQYIMIKIARAAYKNKPEGGILFRLRLYNMLVVVIPVVLIFLTLFSSVNTHKIRKTHGPGKYVSITQRPTLDAYFDKWFEHNVRDSIFKNGDTTIYLISGQGGGSRAGAWFFMNMAKMEKDYPEFYRKTFSISTVSGSSVGAYMYLGAKYYNRPIQDIKKLSSDLFARNYMSSAFWGLLLGDGIDGIANHLFAPKNSFPKDRNYHLQKEEMTGFQDAFHIKDASDYFEGDFFHIYEDSSRKFPLFFINTAIIEKGTQGIFAPVKLVSVSMARDLYAEFKRGDNNGDHNIPITTSVNQSQAFPLLSAFNYMDWVGRFIDGGIYENTGCGTTLEIYQALRKYLNTKEQYKGIKIVLYNIANTRMVEDYTAEYKNASILNSLTAIVNTPFGGHQNFAYKNLGRQVAYLNTILHTHDTVIDILLKEDITLTRQLSNNSIHEMYGSLKD